MEQICVVCLRHARRLVRIGLVVLMLLCCSEDSDAVEVPGLYQAETIVTGRGETERWRGFKVGLEAVLVKRSGNVECIRSAGVRRLVARAADFVARYEYADRMQGIPIHDEQGTRERPYFLRMTFKPSMVDDALGALSIPLWSHDRPRVLVWLGIQDAVRFYVLGTETVFGYGQREVLTSVAKERGVPILLPTMDAEEQTVMTYARVREADLPRLRLVSQRYGAQALLIGTLVIDENDYWTLTWAIDWQGRIHRSQLTDVTFDVALRAAIEGSAKIFATVSAERQ